MTDFDAAQPPPPFTHEFPVPPSPSTRTTFPPASVPDGPAARSVQVPPPPPAAPRRRRFRRAAVGLGVAAVILASAGAGAIAGYVAGRDDPAPTALSSTPVVPAVDLSDGGDVGAIVEAAEGSVVSIETVVTQRQGPFVTEGEGAGTGVVIDDDGHILTNAHVVAGATSVTVSLDGGTGARPAEVIGADESADIAVLRVDDTTDLVAAQLAPDDAVAVGDDVVAIGNALALDGGLTVTKGIVSALDRSIDTQNGTIDGLIQTDAAISSGNSGGALVDTAGRVVGINTAIAASGGGIEATNIGFAIDIGDALRIASDILDGGGRTSQPNTVRV